MSWLTISALLAWIANVAIGTFVLSRNPRNLTNSSFATMTFCMALWATVDIVVHELAITHDLALTITRISYLGGVFVPSTFLCFILRITDRSLVLGRVGLSISMLLLPLFLSPLMIQDIQITPYIEIPGAFYPIFLIFLVGCLLYGIALLAHSLSNCSPYQRNQRKYVLFATATGLAAVVAFSLFTYRWNIPPIHYLIEVGVAAIFATAIVRYRLMDITVVVTRTTIFASVYALLLGVPLGGALIHKKRLEGFLGENWWIWIWGISSVLATVAHYLNLYLQRRAEETLTKEQRRYQTTLFKASYGMTKVRDLDRLLNLIVHVVTKSVQLVHGAIFLRSLHATSYAVRISRDRQRISEQLEVPFDHPLIEIVTIAEGPIVTEELELMTRQFTSSEFNKTHRAIEFLKEHDIALLVPSFVDDQMIGFLALGAKRSGDPFTQDDINVFTTLANQAGLAVENALFFEELKTTQAQLFQSDKLATLGQLASSMAHEIHNPLAVISGEAQLLLASKADRDEQTKEFLRDIVAQCKRAEEITDRLLTFTRGARDKRYLQLELNEVAAESVKLVEHQIKMDNIKLGLSFFDPLPKVIGNRTQIQEIFLNLSLNACQAMKEAYEQGDRHREQRLDISTEVRQDSVVVRFADTGPGISEENLKQIFNPYFTTKASGTGLGLFICDRIIREHNGKMTVESRLGVGTTFEVIMPVAGSPDAPSLTAEAKV